MRFDGMSLKQLLREEELLMERVENLTKMLDSEELELEEEMEKRERYWHYMEQLEEVRDIIFSFTCQEAK